MREQIYDPYVYPGTHTLINKFGIKDPDKLATIERNLTANRLAELYNNPINGNFDFDHLKKIHGYIFQDVYDWAGKERTVTIAKGNTLFCPAEKIEIYADKIFDALKRHDYLKGLGPNEFSKKAALFFANLNDLHPFREGNGRTQREFMRELSINAGYNLDLSKAPRTLMNKYSEEGHFGKFDNLETLIYSQLKPVEKEKFKDMGMEI